MHKKAMLVILDGRGNGDGGVGDAIAAAKTPTMDKLLAEYPSAHLHTYGEYVGLPDGQMGNSEVGHLNIGAGRVVYQDFAKINKEIREKDFFLNPVLLQAFAYAKEHNKKVHLLGLLGDGGVHAHQSHLYALCEMAQVQGVEDVFIHLFTDGRDTSPHSAVNYMKELQNFLQNSSAKIASFIGRYYAMDRDNRRERVKLAYNLLVKGEGKYVSNPLQELQNAYAENITDEFMMPTVIVGEDGKPLAHIEHDDVVIFFNYRTDRPRELSHVLVQTAQLEHDMSPLSLYFVTMTRYDDTLTNVRIAYDKDNLLNTLGEVISHAGRTQLRIAETEKYPHVTFFFSGGREQVFEGEKRIVIPSPKVATYDLQPEMSANEVKEAVISEIENNQPDFIALNFANPDMVGHTGVFSAVVKAVEAVDECLGLIVTSAQNHGYGMVIIADHGNADRMINEDGTVHTAHTTNMVPCIVISPDVTALHEGKLADVSPTILALMGISQPQEMDGISLIKSN